MITIDVSERRTDKKTKAVSIVKRIGLFRSMDKAKKEIIPIVQEMRAASKAKREPTIRIDAVSFDSEAEKAMLKDIGALKTTD